MLADIVTISYLVSNEQEEVERTLRFLVTVTAIRQEVFRGVEQHTGIMDQDTARWFIFMTSFSEDVKSERLSEEGQSAKLESLSSSLTDEVSYEQREVSSIAGFECC
jgi:hypothetical protein